MSSVLIEAHFLPSIEYFCALHAHESIVIEKHEHFIKQSYRNRCYVLTAHGVARLTVPLTGASAKVPVHQVQIDYGSRWQANMWRTLQSAYAKAPYFEFYTDDLRAELFSNTTTLFSLNTRLLSMCLKWLGWRKNITETMAYVEKSDQTDLRNTISAKSDFSQRPFYCACTYQQVFGKQFVPNLSVLDLVFCMGPEARNIIQSSASKLNK
ncbi:MAG: WbqC family protein [Cytophagales bacterium]|nr:WbqC family protein [Cytophagales bacterium]